MKERLKFVIKSFDKSTNFTKLCREFGISTKTGYKWRERFLEGGEPALEDKSRRPLSNSQAISPEIVCAIVRIKIEKKNWGAKKIREVFKNRYPLSEAPSRSSIERILKKSGFVDSKKRSRINNTSRIQNRVKSQEANDIWTVDFKGWWYTPQREKCEPLTVRDDFSKFILSIKILEKGDISSVKAEFERIFKQYGLPNMIRSDNGPPFASSMGKFGLTKLSVWWLSLGIRLDRIDPGSPYQNGGHERMHLDMMKELEGKIDGDLELHQSIFDVWRNEFNTERPHEAINMQTPASIYRRSKRKYKVFDSFIYPKSMVSRQVNTRGYTLYKGRRIFIGNAFNGYNVGIKDESDGEIKIFFANYWLGNIDRKSFSFTPNNEIILMENI